LLDLLGLSLAVQPPSTLSQGVRAEGIRILNQARDIAFPGEGADAWAMKDLLPNREYWRQTMQSLDSWLESIEAIEQEYAHIVQGEAMSAEEMHKWAESVSRPTAVLFWFLGEQYSYQVVLSAYPGVTPKAPAFIKVPVTVSWLRTQTETFQSAVQNRHHPPESMLKDLSDALIMPVADYLRNVEVVYICPTQSLHSLPIQALSLDGEPLNVCKETSITPSLSVLRVLQYIDRSNRPAKQPVAFGPQFPDAVGRIAKLTNAEVVPHLSVEDRTRPIESVADCESLYLICHGFHDPHDPWESGLQYPAGTTTEILAGRNLMKWRLQAHLAVLEACDTRRQHTTATDDGFGLGRFLHISGVPSLLLADWEVRTDVSLRFMRAFYESLTESSSNGTTRKGRGAAYRAGVRAARSWTGSKRPFLWAPFALVGVAD
jgi:CHAT domain-containing protein